jgi:hypothetical protein
MKNLPGSRRTDLYADSSGNGFAKVLAAAAE